MPRTKTQVETRERLKRSPKLQKLLGDLMHDIPKPNGDPNQSLRSNRTIQERLIIALQLSGESLFPGINEMIGLLAAREQELLKLAGPQC
jgi:hypothetical protein